MKIFRIRINQTWNDLGHSGVKVVESEIFKRPEPKTHNERVEALACSVLEARGERFLPSLAMNCKIIAGHRTKSLDLVLFDSNRALAVLEVSRSNLQRQKLETSELERTLVDQAGERDVSISIVCPEDSMNELDNYFGSVSIISQSKLSDIVRSWPNL